MKKKLLIATFSLISVLFACENNYNKFFTNNIENFKKIGALDLRAYNLISYEHGKFIFDKDIGIHIQKKDSIKISELLKELGLKTPL